MNFKVKFFEDSFLDAIGAGVYEIYIQRNGDKQLLYVGESVFVLVRCATHLYEIVKGKGYLGFNKENLENDCFTLVFKLYSMEPDEAKKKQSRKQKEKEVIEKNPIMQSGINDRVKSIEEMINQMTSFLSNENQNC